MDISKFLFPAFKMRIRSYDPKHQIELEGVNNWSTLIIGHLALIILSIPPTVLLVWFTFEYFLGRLLILVILLIVGNFSYTMLSSARNRYYIKEEIKFSKKGIFIKPHKHEKDGKLIPATSLIHMKLVSDGTHFKFLLYGLEKPYFEFIVPINSSFNLDHFTEDFSNLLGIVPTTGASFKQQLIIEFERKTDELMSLKSPPVSERMQTREVSSLLIIPLDYKAETFQIYMLNDELVIKERQEEGYEDIPKKLRISKKEKLLWHRRMLVYREEIKFSEIKDFDYKVELVIKKGRGEFIVGKFYARIQNKSKKIFAITKNVSGLAEVTALEVMKDLEYLKRLMKTEMDV